MFQVNNDCKSYKKIFRCNNCVYVDEFFSRRNSPWNLITHTHGRFKPSIHLVWELTFARFYGSLMSSIKLQTDQTVVSHNLCVDFAFYFFLFSLTDMNIRRVRCLDLLPNIHFFFLFCCRITVYERVWPSCILL